MQVLFQTIRHCIEIEQLERKVEKHNSVVERVAIAENTLKSQQHQIDELKGDM